MGYEIKKGEPTLSSLGAPNKYPWKDLAVGDSFDVPFSDTSSSTVQASASLSGKRLGRKFATSAKFVPGHTRVQRIA